MDNYRFGFNGQEQDNEITGQTGTHTTAMFWEYDARLGRRWNVDPVVKEFESPYLCFSGNPIWLVDIFGADTSFSDDEARNDFKTAYSEVSNKIIEQSNQIDMLQDDLVKEGITEEQKTEIMGKLDVLYAEREQMYSVKESFDDIIVSEYMFFYNAKPNPLSSTAGGSNSWNSEMNRYEINYYTGNKKSMIHETKHGQQRLNGNLRWYDYRDELDAYLAAEGYEQIILKIPAMSEEELRKMIELNYSDKVQVKSWEQVSGSPKSKLF